MKFQKTLFAVALLGLTGAVANVDATAVTSTFQVTATVIKSCTISTSPISFGNYDPTSTTAVSAQGSVSATCTKGTPVTVALDQGLNKTSASTAAAPARQMVNGTSLLPYDIYTTSGSTTEWATPRPVNRPTRPPSASKLRSCSTPTVRCPPAPTCPPATTPIR
jgi:spore coat protein U-like protein